MRALRPLLVVVTIAGLACADPAPNSPALDAARECCENEDVDAEVAEDVDAQVHDDASVGSGDASPDAELPVERIDSPALTICGFPAGLHDLLLDVGPSASYGRRAGNRAVFHDFEGW